MTSSVATSGLAESESPSPLTVLIVEETPADARSIELALGHLGHLVITATSIGAAEAILSAFAVDAVICEIKLCDGLGDDLLPAIRRQPGRVATIAICRECVMQAAPGVCRAFDRQMVKPLDYGHLDQALNLLCGRSSDA